MILSFWHHFLKQMKKIAPFHRVWGSKTKQLFINACLHQNQSKEGIGDELQLEPEKQLKHLTDFLTVLQKIGWN